MFARVGMLPRLCLPAVTIMGMMCFRSGGPSLCKTATSGLPGARAEQSDGFLSSGRSPQAPRHAPLPSTSGMPCNDSL